MIQPRPPAEPPLVSRWIPFPSHRQGCDRPSIISALAAMVLLVAPESTPRADSLPDPPDDYCARVWERARSDAALLFGPRIGVQAIRFPPASGTDVAGWSVAQRQTQVRPFLDYSLTNVLEGRLALDRADAECRRRKLSRPVEEAIRIATDQGRRAALLKEIAFLAEKAPEVARLEREAEKRLEEQVSTLSELTETRLFVLNLQQTQLDAEEAVARIEAMPASEPTGPVSQLAERYREATMEVERIDSRMRRIEPWSLSLRGGLAATPASSSVDWFGAVELGYNLGGLVRIGAERNYLAARSRELESTAAELLPAARTLDGVLAGSVERLKRDSQILEETTGQLGRDAAALEHADTARQSHAIAVLTLRRLAVEARLVYLRELAQQRHPWEGHHER
jgi:hypothetical protein